MSVKVEYMSKNKQFKVAFEGSSEKEVFEKVAHFQEVFENHNTCVCGSSDVSFGVRNVDGNNYYEKICQSCGKKFAYGQNKKGDTLFPKNDKGWHKWVPGQEDDEEEVKPKNKSVKK